MSDNYRPDLSEFGVIIPPESDSTTTQKEHQMAQPSEPATVRIKIQPVIDYAVPSKALRDIGDAYAELGQAFQKCADRIEVIVAEQVPNPVQELFGSLK